MIIEVVGKEIEKIKGDFESYLNGLNMVGEISYSQYSELYDEGTKQIQKAYELGKSDLEKENAELKDYRLTTLAKQQTGMSKYALNLEHKLSWYDDQLTKAKEIIKELMSFSVQLCDCRHTVDFEKTREEAEQFLSEVEK